MAYLLIRMTTPPYSCNNAEEGLDFALAATNFGHDVKMLFEGEGVWQLLNTQAPPDSTSINHAKRLSALPMFDIEECFVCAESVASLDITQDDLLDIVTPVTSPEKRALLANAQHVVTF